MVDISFILSGYQDSNLGPSAPKADALTGLRYTPNRFASANITLFSLRCTKNAVSATTNTAFFTNSTV